jgi:hypothetical protein
LVNQLLDTEKRWKMVAAALDFLHKNAKETETKVDDTLVAFAEAGVADEEFRELADQLIRDWLNAEDGGKLSLPAACGNPTLEARAKVLADKMNASLGGRFIDWKNVNWEKVLEIVMFIITNFAVAEDA